MKYRIVLVELAPIPIFGLVREDTSEMVQTHHNPRHLSKVAFANDADEVRWEFDLKLADT